MLVQEFNKSLLQFIKNLQSRDSIRAGIHLDERRGKLILLPLLFTELLKFAPPEKFSSEVDKIKNILRENGYPEEVIISRIKKKI